MSAPAKTQALEALDELLREQHGPRWWEKLGWQP